MSYSGLIEDLLGRRDKFPILGEGAYGKVYDLPGHAGMVLKLARKDGTADWIEWCYMRGRKYGLNSVEMDGLPRVYEFRRLVFDDWACLMEKYDCTAQQLRMRGETSFGEYEVFAANIASMLRPIFGRDFFNDMHGGNIMWSEKRQQFVLTDPCCGTTEDTAPPSQPSLIGPPPSNYQSRDYRGFLKGAPEAMPKKVGPRGNPFVNPWDIAVGDRVQFPRPVIEGCGCAMCNGGRIGPMPMYKAARRFDNLPRKVLNFEVQQRFMMPFDQRIRPLKKYFDDWDVIEKQMVKEFIKPVAPVVTIGPGRNRKEAQWNKAPLQQLHHMK